MMLVMPTYQRSGLIRRMDQRQQGEHVSMRYQEVLSAGNEVGFTLGLRSVRSTTRFRQSRGLTRVCRLTYQLISHYVSVFGSSVARLMILAERLSGMACVVLPRTERGHVEVGRSN